MLGQFPVFRADVGDQNGGHLIQLAQSAHSGTFGQKLLGGIGKLTLIAIVECFVRRISRIVAAHLELFLIAEMLVYIIVEEFGGVHQFFPAFTLSAGVQQIVDGGEKLFVLSVNQIVAGK